MFQARFNDNFIYPTDRVLTVLRNDLFINDGGFVRGMMEGMRVRLGFAVYLVGWALFLYSPSFYSSLLRREKGARAFHKPRVPPFTLTAKRVL